MAARVRETERERDSKDRERAMEKKNLRTNNAGDVNSEVCVRVCVSVTRLCSLILFLINVDRNFNQRCYKYGKSSSFRFLHAQFIWPLQRKNRKQ